MFYELLSPYLCFISFYALTLKKLKGHIALGMSVHPAVHLFVCPFQQLSYF